MLPRVLPDTLHRLPDRMLMRKAGDYSGGVRRCGPRRGSGAVPSRATPATV